VSRQNNSDPLPFVQIDRAVEPAAALLAGHLKVTHQHAIGSLYAFWKLCADPRELEAVIESTPVGTEPAVCLDAEDVALRFDLASGTRVEPVVLERLGLLEPDGARYRVRGMSRYLDAVADRLQARKAASAGGKASAESRKRSSGTAQPRSGGRSASGSVAVRSAPEATPEATPKRARSGHRSDAEASPNPRGQRSEVRVQILEKLAGKPRAAVEEADLSEAPDWKALVARIVEMAPGYAFTPRDARALKACLALAKGDALDVAWRWGVAWRHEGFPRVRAIHELERTWNHWAVGAKAPDIRAPVAAESVDWTDVVPGEVLL
jgi:hypothetical protein